MLTISKLNMKASIEKRKLISLISFLLIISNTILLICSQTLISVAAPTPEVGSSSQHLESAGSDLVESVIESAASAPPQSASLKALSPIATNQAISSSDAGDLKVSSSKEAPVDHLQSQETFLGGHTPYHHSPVDTGYNYDKNAYGKQAQDWSLYDQGNHGHYDKYGDKAWNEHGHNGQTSHGKHDSYGNNYNTQNSGHGSGYYSRDRGYGYEKHYAYDKEVASKQHADNHNTYGSNHGLHDYYGNSESKSHGNQGHDKYGQLSRYGNHGYGKRGAHLDAHHNYEHSNKFATPPISYGHNHHSSYQSSYPDYHVPTYRSTYADYSPQVGYPSSYPSYY